ncbi:MAG: AI-2E family transporter [Ginsengibacter sp.]
MNKAPNKRSGNIIETVLVVFLLIALLVSLYTVLHLFFGVLTFALVFAISFEGLYEGLVIRIKNKRKTGAFLYALSLIVVLAVPLFFLFSSLSRNVRPALRWINEVKVNGLPPLPQSVANMPIAGKRIAKLWDQYHGNPKQIINDYGQQVHTLSEKVLNSGLTILQTMLEIIIGIIISAFFLIKKKEIISAILLPLERLLGERSGQSLLDAIAMAIRGVSIGVMGTAFIAASLSLLGFTIAGVHFSVGLAAIVFFLVVLQVGPLPLWIPLVIWMATQDHPGKLVFLIIWGVLLLAVDAIVKPILIGKSGGKLPFLVLFLGVVGGLAAWGFTGMFKGAIILAVFYTVYNSWLKNAPANAVEVPYE